MAPLLHLTAQFTQLLASSLHKGENLLSARSCQNRTPMIFGLKWGTPQLEPLCLMNIHENLVTWAKIVPNIMDVAGFEEKKCEILLKLNFIKNVAIPHHSCASILLAYILGFIRMLDFHNLMNVTSPMGPHICCHQCGRKLKEHMLQCWNLGRACTSETYTEYTVLDHSMVGHVSWRHFLPSSVYTSVGLKGKNTEIWENYVGLLHEVLMVFFPLTGILKDIEMWLLL